MAIPKMRPHRAPERMARRALRRATTVPGDRWARTGATGAATASSACMAVLAVLGKEEFLERGLAADQLGDAGVGEDPQQGLDGASDLAPDHATVRLHRADPGHAREVGDRPVEGRLDAERAQVAHLGQGADLHQAALAEDAHPVAER